MENDELELETTPNPDQQEQELELEKDNSEDPKSDELDNQGGDLLINFKRRFISRSKKV